VFALVIRVPRSTSASAHAVSSANMLVNRVVQKDGLTFTQSFQKSRYKN
jgi:hypothetical protein